MNRKLLWIEGACEICTSEERERERERMEEKYSRDPSLHPWYSSLINDCDTRERETGR